MPLLEVELVGDVEPAVRSGLAPRIADAAGKVLGARPGAVWVRVRSLPVEDYAEDGGGLPAGVLPVFVRIVRKLVPAGASLDSEVQALTTAVAIACGRPSEHVHVLYESAGTGLLAFGGKLVK